MRLSVLLMSLALGVATASSVAAQEPPTQAALAEAGTKPGEPATSAASGKAGAPPAGKGQVVFFRPSSIAGIVQIFSIHEGDKGICKLASGDYCVVPVDAGLHTFTVEAEVTDRLSLEIDEGETYYVEHIIGAGITSARPRLRPSTITAFEAKKLKLGAKTPSDRKPKAD